MAVLRANVGGTWVDIAPASDVRVWNGAWGIVAQNAINAPQGGISTETVITGSQLVVPTIAGRRYRITINCAPASDTAGTTAAITIRRDTTGISSRAITLPVATTSQEFHLEATHTETVTGNRTFDATLQRLAGTGTVSIGSTPVYLSWMTVEDLGPTAVTVLPPQVPVANPGNALGIIAVGTPTNRAGVALPATENLGPPLNVYTQVGRRYRFVVNGVRAATASPATYLAFFFTGPGISGRVDWYRLVGSAYDSLNAEVVFDGQGSVGTYTIQINPGAVGLNVWTEPTNCGFYVEDCGPITPVGVADVVVPTAVPWQPFPFAAGWGYYGSGFAVPGYRKIGDIVYLRGLCNPASGSTALMGTLPAGYRPANIELCWAATNSTTGEKGRVDINSAGAVTQAPGAFGVGLWQSLSGIQFSVTA